MTRLLSMLLATLWLALPTGAGATPEEPEKSVFILLDTSGSMKSNNGMVMARAALGTLLDEMASDDDYRTALIKSHGNNVVVPMAAGNIEAIRARIDYGHGDDNPIRTLERFSSEVLARTPGCHVVLVVTDGDDGSQPGAAAADIRSRCSRLYIVGVGLGENSERILAGIAVQGGGRFCNGAETAAITRCILSVFKRYQFDTGRNSCVDSNGLHGRNKLPKISRLGALKDWDCYDFSGQDLSAGGLQKHSCSRSSSGTVSCAFDSTGVLKKSVRGSLFAGANLTGVRLQHGFAAARFTSANLGNATVQGDRHDLGVDFSGANLAGATLRGGQQGCVRDWNFSGARLDNATLSGFSACKIRLDGKVSLAGAHDVELRDLRVDKGLSLQLQQGGKVTLADVSGTALEISSPMLAQLRLQGVRLATLTLSDIQRGSSVEGSALELSDIRAGTAFTLARIVSSQLRISALETPLLTMELPSARSYIERSSIGKTTVDSRSIAFEETRLGPAAISGRDSVRFEKNSKCTGCRLKADQGSRLAIRDSSLDDLVLEGRWHLDAYRANLARAHLRSVNWEADSSMEEVVLEHARFENTGTALVLADVRLNHSVFSSTGSHVTPGLTLIDGSRNVQCMNCGKLRVDIDADHVDKLKLTGTDSELSLRSSSQELELKELDIRQSSLRSNAFDQITCRNCYLDGATLEGNLGGLELINPRADGIRLKGFSSFAKEAVLITGGSLKGAILGGHDEAWMILDKTDLSGAVFEDVAFRGEASATPFTGVVFKRGIRQAEILNSDLSKAQFPALADGIKDSSFHRTRFSGTVFPDYHEHSRNVVFENCWFDGLYGQATLKRLLHGTRGLRVSNTSWAGADLAGVSQQNVELTSVNLRGANLARINLGGLKLDNVDMAGADLEGASLHGEISNSSFSGAKVGGASIGGQLSGVSLANLVEGSRFLHLTADLEDVNLSGSDLHNVYPENASQRPVYRRLTLHDGIVSCAMLDLMREQKTVTYGSYRARNWDALGGDCPPEAPAAVAR